jgi:uncharacterized protein YjbI with pentapeptide repeats
MSVDGTRKVVSRAVLEEDFRRQLFSDPDAALEGYDLTVDEKSALRSIPAETIDNFANNLEERISLSLVAFGAELFGPEVQGAELFGPEVQGAELFGPEVQGAELLGPEVQGAELLGPEVQGAELLGPEVQGAELLGPEVQGAEMLGPEVEGAEMLGPEVEGAEMLGPEAQGAGLGGELEATRSANWLLRLAAALGIRSGYGGGPRNIEMY